MATSLRTATLTRILCTYHPSSIVACEFYVRLSVLRSYCERELLLEIEIEIEISRSLSREYRQFNTSYKLQHNADTHSHAQPLQSLHSTDLFLISGDPSTQKLAVYTFYSSDFTYKFEGDAVINEPNILNVAPGDFNYDGRLDVLVTGDRNGQLYMHLYYGDLKSFRFGYIALTILLS